MFTRALLTVFLFAAGITCADAGVMFGEDGVVIASDVDLVDVLTSMSDENSPVYVQDCERGNEMAAASQVRSQNNATSAIVSSNSKQQHSAIPHWRISLENSLKPPNPVIDGLLKPA